MCIFSEHTLEAFLMMVFLKYCTSEFPFYYGKKVHCFKDVVALIVFVAEASLLLSLFGPEGTDSEPRLDFRVDESSDVPILEDRSSSPIDFPQEQWLVGMDIQNIERYTYSTCF